MIEIFQFVFRQFYDIKGKDIQDESIGNRSSSG